MMKIFKCGEQVSFASIQKEYPNAYVGELKVCTSDLFNLSRELDLTNDVPTIKGKVVIVLQSHRDGGGHVTLRYGDIGTKGSIRLLAVIPDADNRDFMVR